MDMNIRRHQLVTVLGSALLLFACEAHARLDETGEEIAKRFGDQERVHPQLSNAAWAFHELEGACRREPGPEDKMAELFDRVRHWNWDDADFRGYRRGKVTILVILLNDKAVFEHYMQGATFSDEDLNQLLSAQSGGSKWKRSNNSGDTIGSIRTWRTIDPATEKPSRYAITNGGSSISFYSPAIIDYCIEAARRMASDAEKNKKKTMDGF